MKSKKKDQEKQLDPGRELRALAEKLKFGEVILKIQDGKFVNLKVTQNYKLT